MGKRKRTLSAMLLLLVFAAIGCAGGASYSDAGEDLQRIAERYPSLTPDKAQRGTVKRVVDGDTFELADGSKVRLIGVNTPEIHGNKQPYGEEAAAFTTRELAGRPVVLYPDVSDRDRYGRLLRYVFVSGSDVMFNERLVSDGYAQVMTVPPDVAFAETFVELQKEARLRGAGLWGPEAGNDEKAAAATDADGAEAPPVCPNPIKGNINSKGEKIYHVPGGRSYEATKPERWFCTEEKAKDAGFRKAKN